MATRDIEDAVADCDEAENGRPAKPATYIDGADAWGKDVDFDELERQLAALPPEQAKREKLRRIAPEVISCSRRTDVPARYSSGLVKILKRGQVLVVVRDYHHLVSLSPETVKAWVWWSKNYGPWIKAFQANSELFTRYRAHLFHFTITGLTELESLEATLEERLAQVGFLAKLGKVVVRFDPVTRYRGADGVVRSNSALAAELIPLFKAAGAHEVEFKFCVDYAGTRGTRPRMLERGHEMLSWPPGRKRAVTRELMAICAQVDIPLRACCPTPDEMVEGLQVGSCVDGEAINQMLAAPRSGSTGEAAPVGLRKDKGQRTACKCVESKDVGSSRMTCENNCDYCYAQPGPTNPDFL